MNKKPGILIVDDEPLNVKLLQAYLLPQGYDVITACDGNDALKKVEENDIDLILLDIMMPGIDGFEVTRRLKIDETKRGIPIILITSLTDVESKINGIKAGCDEFLSKPIDHMELNVRIKSLLKVKAYYDHLCNYQKELETEVAKKTNQLLDVLRELKNASLDTIHRLSQAAEYKDEETGEHIRRIGLLSSMVVEQMKLDSNTAEEILYAAPMHDIGKIGIPDRILLKPGKLDHDEWEVMKQHVNIGAKILDGSDASFIKMAHVIALTHHERWDGSGYPNKLEKNNIPVVGRIAAVCDTFDALTSKRPYKESFPVEKAFNIIRENSGTHFDPEVVDAFFNAEEKILSIKECYKDLMKLRFY